MRVLRQHEYGNPLDVAIRHEQEGCKGCAHEFKAEGFGVTMWVCIKLDDIGRRRKHGERCKNYKEMSRGNKAIVCKSNAIEQSENG